MIDFTFKLLIFTKDFTDQGADRFYWLAGEQLAETNAAEVASFTGAVICHDFWIIRDALFDKAGDLPKVIIDLDEFNISTSGTPEDRHAREKSDITVCLEKFGAPAELCSAYKRMFNRGSVFDSKIAAKIAIWLEKLYLSLCEAAKANDELERFFDIELPVYRLLQKAMSVGIAIDPTGLSEKRREAEFDYFYSLKNYAAKHYMPLETPTETVIENKLKATGFDFSGVSVDYILEYVPHDDDFGNDTIMLRNCDTARRVLSSLTLSSTRTRPIIDVFGSRTSRVHIRSPMLQNIPKKYRSLIAAPAGAELSYVDFDQYEVGIMASLSQDQELASLYAAGDMYDLFATSHLGLTGNRKAAKQLFLSYAYGMSRNSLIDAAVSLGAERHRAKRAFKLFVQYEAWKQSVWSDFQRDGRISTILGNHYKREKIGPINAKEQRSAISQVIQGTASLIFKKALIEVDKLDDVIIVLPMHDALLFGHRQKLTPSTVVAVFEKTMTSVLGGRINGKASVGAFIPNPALL